MKVGFVGLGRMGQEMARRLLDGGHDVLVYNRTRDKTAPLLEAGAFVADSIEELAHETDIVISMLADDHAVTQVATAPSGLIASLPQGGVHIAMGTHSIGAMRSLAQSHSAAGQFLICAPVMGRPEAVAAGRAVIVAAGNSEAIARCRPLFTAIGRRLFEAGTEPESASAVKIANNFMLGCAIEAMGEAFALVQKCGVAPSMFADFIGDGLFTSPAYTGYAKVISNRDFEHVGFTAMLGLKDANLALTAGELARVPLPSLHVWRERLLSAIARGEGHLDWAVMTREQARASGLNPDEAATVPPKRNETE